MILLERCLHTINVHLNIRWSDFVTNILIQVQAEIPSIEAMLFKYHLRWAGHVSRMDDHRLPMEVASLQPDHLPTLSAAKTSKLSLLVIILAIDVAS